MSLGGLDNSSYGAVNLVAELEVGYVVSAIGDSVEQSVNLEDLHVVVSDGDTSSRLECGVALHQRVEQYGAEAAGALVVNDPNTGEILTILSYPTYDLNTYSEKYSELSKDERTPLWNRALRSTYAIGSPPPPLEAISRARSPRSP